MPLTTKGTPYVVSTDLVANYPTVSSDLANHIDANLQYNAQDINAQTGSGANAYTFALADASLYKLVTATNAATATYTVPPQSAVTWANGAVLRILNQGAGVVTLAGGAGVTLNGSVLTLNQYQYAEIHRTASNTWTVIGIATPPGMTKVTDQSVSAVASVSFDNCFTSTFANYRIVVFLTAVSTGNEIFFKFRNAGSDRSAAAYLQANRAITDGGTLVSRTGAGQTTGMSIGYTNSSHTFASSLDIYSPLATQRGNVAGLTFGFDSAGGSFASWRVGGKYNDASTSDGFSLLTSTGTMTGSVRVYGYRN